MTGARSLTRLAFALLVTLSSGCTHPRLIASWHLEPHKDTDAAVAATGSPAGKPSYDVVIELVNAGLKEAAIRDVYLNRMVEGRSRDHAKDPVTLPTGHKLRFRVPEVADAQCVPALLDIRLNRRYANRMVVEFDGVLPVATAPITIDCNQ